MANDENTVISDLRSCITELQDELKQKTSALDRKIRNSVTFENDVLEAESQHKSIMEECQIKIRDLEERSSEQQKRNGELLERAEGTEVGKTTRRT